MRHIELNHEIVYRREDGFFDLDKDREAVRVYEAEISSSQVSFDSVAERIAYMVDNHYYYDVLSQYSVDQIEEIYRMVNDYEFTFSSYMAISKFYRDYAVTSNDKKQYLETYVDRIIIVALYLAQGEVKKAANYTAAMIEQRYQPATPTFLNAGKARRGEMVSCYLLELDDSLNSITYNLSTAMQLSKLGGGIALNLSKLRARGEEIKGIANASSGVMPVAKILEDSFSYVNQLGQRKGAGAVYINIFHWDANELLDSKKINADEKSRLQSLSIGLICPAIFFELAERDEDLYVFAPYSVYQAYGRHFDDMDLDQMYHELLQHPDVKKKRLMSAREMLVKIAMIQLESGYPYLIFLSNANRQHPLKGVGRIKMSNLCTEIFQLQETSTINDYGVEDIIRRDISCNLGSLNIANVMETGLIRESVHTGMEMLTAVSDMTSVSNAPGVQKANAELHSVGLGAMNLHGYLAKNGIPFESEEAKDFANTFFMMVNFYSLEKSMLIAKERQTMFAGFERSDYATGVYFAKYLAQEYAPRTKKVGALFEGISIPARADWQRLKEEIQTYGLYHAYRLACAPTASISYIQNATSSVMPIVEQIETRTYGNATTYYPAPFLAKENVLLYKSAYNMDMFKLIDLIAVIQQHIDQGISTILYVNSDISTRELARYYIYANRQGLKSLYYTRTNKRGIEECIACAV
ncbi:class 1b ribonucleoside-diphosphate reductase subunit alpha [Brevibacillus humidisoli]|uniref:class 1b ribonucleoside-diphosphate reductase subunit alpha n=1 Tax=Brevibacillus humidisoli TaxID=2895522 RepID=UPI001E4E285C|nr:class 1b ribonucleoside-diphosphate reductase subunit alpha [Brevibacillus humidisoli]UFJ40758.1 class 1b ribonucleoside-diphosphate reductase subunit alpha [Brevibacillus humidisoli]